MKCSRMSLHEEGIIAKQVGSLKGGRGLDCRHGGKGKVYENAETSLVPDFRFVY